MLYLIIDGVPASAPLLVSFDCSSLLLVMSILAEIKNVSVITVSLKCYYNKILTTVQNDPAVGIADFFLVFHGSHPPSSFAALHKIPVTQAERHIDETNVKIQQWSRSLFFI